jgi:hypothetical protein
MIPRCNDEGYLPPGIHPATLEETIWLGVLVSKGSS